MLNQSGVELERTFSTIKLRIVPFLILCYFIFFVDRVNVGFAALQMNRDLGLSPAVFGLGNALYFVSFFIFEIPSNLALQKFGAPRWMGRIMISWGLISAGMLFISGETSFYVMRFLLGAAEAGFFPGIILYLTFWFPEGIRARVIALFMIAIPVSSFLGSPISGLILQLDGTYGWAGWQWLFFLEGIPAVVLGFLCFSFLPRDPSTAPWLSLGEKELLAVRLNEPTKAGRPIADQSIWYLLQNRYVLALALVYGGSAAISSGLQLWQPQILKSFGLSNMQTGFLNAVPFGIASIAMIIWGNSSDNKSERIWHTSIPLLFSALGLGLFIGAGSLAFVVFSLCIAVVGTYAIKGPFWALSTEWLPSKSAAVGIAQINSVGNLLGGIVGGYLPGLIKESSGSYTFALAPLILIVLAAAVSVMIAGRGQLRALKLAD